MADISWLKAFFAFNVFADENDHGTLPATTNTAVIPGTSVTERDLAQWIRKQNRDPQNLSRQQISALNHASFPWTVSRAGTREHNKGQLVEFREKHGHCNVPQKHGALGLWVKNLKASYKKHCAGHETALTSHFIHELREIGFEWCSDDSWKAKFALLDTYSKEKGDCDVPRSHKLLGRWVSEQRAEYKAKTEGKKSKMTTERIDSLNGLAFKWKINRKSSKVTGESSEI